MENFFYEDNFCSDLGDLMLHLDIEEEDVANLPDDYKVEVMQTTKEQMFQVDANSLADDVVEKLSRTYEERYPTENYESTDKKIKDVFIAAFNVLQFNSWVPSLYYPTGPDATITKADLLEFIS